MHGDREVSHAGEDCFEIDPMNKWELNYEIGKNGTMHVLIQAL